MTPEISLEGLLRENADLRDALRAANTGLIEALVHVLDEQTRDRLERQIEKNLELLGHGIAGVIGHD